MTDIVYIDNNPGPMNHLEKTVAALIAELETQKELIAETKENLDWAVEEIEKIKK